MNGFAKVGQNKKISDNIFMLKIEVPEVLEDTKKFTPGQFFNLYTGNNKHLLPRPISVFDVNRNEITFFIEIKGEGTKIISECKEGEHIRILGPLGNGFPVSDLSGQNVAIIGGGLGIPPLYFLSKELKKQNNKVFSFLGFRDEPFLISEFKKTSTEIYTDISGNILNIMDKMPNNIDVIFSVGPFKMYEALFSKFKNIPFYISMEERMGCGYGACFSCSIKTRSGKRKVCKDGPVFEASEIFDIKEK